LLREQIEQRRADIESEEAKSNSNDKEKMSAFEEDKPDRARRDPNAHD
jgi:hypothetical protein